MSKLEVDAIEPQSGTTITIGAAGDTVNLVGTLQSNGSALPGDISSVVAGTGLSGGGTTGAVTLNIEAAQPTITSLGTLTGLDLTDNSKIRLGTGNDLEIYHTGTQSVISDVGSGNLNLEGDAKIVLRSSGGSENYAQFFKDGAVELYYDNAKKFETKSDGIDVTGTVYADSISMNDNEIIYLGNSADLRIFHDGSNSYVRDSGTGNLRLEGTDIRIANNGGTADFVRATNGGAVDLLHNNSVKFSTTSTGIAVTGGIALGGTGTANTLDDYEEGTWTPVFSSGTGGYNGSALSIAAATYTKIGNEVNLYCSFAVTGGSSISVGDSLAFTGQPFTPATPYTQRMGVGSTNQSIGGNQVAVGIICATSTNPGTMRFVTTQVNASVSATVQTHFNMKYPT